MERSTFIEGETVTNNTGAFDDDDGGALMLGIDVCDRVGADDKSGKKIVGA